MESSSLAVCCSMTLVVFYHSGTGISSKGVFEHVGTGRSPRFGGFRAWRAIGHQLLEPIELGAI